jgi:flagellar protein FlaJ
MQQEKPLQKKQYSKKVIKQPTQSSKQPTISSSEKKKLMKELNIDPDELENIYKKGKKKATEQYDFTVYVTSPFGSLSNRFFGKLVQKLIREKNPLCTHLSESVKFSGMTILSNTYVSMTFLVSLFGSIILAMVGSTVATLMALQAPFIVLSAILSFIIGGILIFGGMYAYPASEASRKARAIENDLPFAIIHMAAVAGSGAPPLAIFKLLLKSGEYKGLDSEIKKIVNYVNLFGYDLSTALKNVSTRTPSKRFKELLNGLAATIESGGSLKSYLSGVAEDSMTTYKLERKKYVESLSTYSDIYTGILIAAPLLFMVAIAIINMMGGKIGGLAISSIAWGGTLLVIPIVNILFYLFLNITQPGE